MTKMVKEHSVAFRNQAIGQLSAGKSQKEVAELPRVGVATVKRWWRQHRRGECLKKRKGCGRKRKLTRVDKITISKSVCKKRNSCRKLSVRLSKNGRRVSHETIRKYLHHDLNLKPFKPQILPQLTSKQKENWVKFCKERKHWTADNWKHIIFSVRPHLSCFTIKMDKLITSGLPSKMKLPPLNLLSTLLRSRCGE